MKLEQHIINYADKLYKSREQMMRIAYMLDKVNELSIQYQPQAYSNIHHIAMVQYTTTLIIVACRSVSNITSCHETKNTIPTLGRDM